MRFLPALVLVGLLTSATAFAGGPIPRPAPDLSWTGSDGKKLSLAQFKGKVVALEIMSTTCSHCQDCAVILQKLTAEFGAKGFQAVAMSINDDANLPQFIKQFNISFPVGKGTRESALMALQHSVMSQFYFPGLLLIDRNGVIQAQYTGADAFLQANEEANIRGVVAKMMGSTPAAGAKPAAKAPAKKQKK